MVLFAFQFYPVCNFFRKFISFGLGTVRSERDKFKEIVLFLLCRTKMSLAVMITILLAF